MYPFNFDFCDHIHIFVLLLLDMLGRRSAPGAGAACAMLPAKLAGARKLEWWRRVDEILELIYKAFNDNNDKLENKICFKCLLHLGHGYRHRRLLRHRESLLVVLPSLHNRCPRLHHPRLSHRTRSWDIIEVKWTMKWYFWDSKLLQVKLLKIRVPWIRGFWPFPLRWRPSFRCFNIKALLGRWTLFFQLSLPLTCPHKRRRVLLLKGFSQINSQMVEKHTTYK